MDGQIWSWVLGIIGLTGFFLAGKKIWWCWYINIFNQLIWVAYSLVTEQYGFLIMSAGYSYVFIQNAIAWTKEHRDEVARAKMNQTIGEVTNVESDHRGVFFNFTLHDKNFVDGMKKTQEKVGRLGMSLRREEDKND